MTKLLAFHNDPAVKAHYLARVTAHEEADEIIRGTYWERGKGCAVGCTIHNPHGGHAAYETELGVPQVLARLEDRIFEGMQSGDSKTFPRRFLSAIPVGADLSLVWPRFAVWLLVDEKHGVARHTKKDGPQWVAIHRVASLYREVIKGREVKRAEWAEARRNATANAATTDATYAATYATYAIYAATYATYAATYATADAATYATYAADATAYADARRQAFKRQSDKLIELLGQSQVEAA